jgi:hypothetical protein
MNSHRVARLRTERHARTRVAPHADGKSCSRLSLLNPARELTTLSRLRLPSRSPAAGPSSVETSEMALLRLLVQPCVVAALSTSGKNNISGVVCAVAAALQRGDPVPADALRTTFSLLGAQPPVLPLELRQLAIMAVREAATNTSLPPADRAEAVRVALAHARALPHPIPPDLRLAHHGPSSDGPAVAAPPPRVRTGVQPVTRSFGRPGSSSPSDVARQGDSRPQPAADTTGGVSATENGHHNGGVARASGEGGGDGAAQGDAKGLHPLSCSWGVFMSIWEAEGFTRSEDVPMCSLEINTIEGLWEACAAAHVFKRLPFSKDTAHRSWVVPSIHPSLLGTRCPSLR